MKDEDRAAGTQSSINDIDKDESAAGGNDRRTHYEGGKRKKDQSPENDKVDESTKQEENEGTGKKLLRINFEDLTHPDALESDQATDLHREDKRDAVPPDAVASFPEEGETTALSSSMLEERGELSHIYVGRIIGKGGETIRDLQARSGCHIDVDQNVAPGEPRIVTYRGRSRDDIALARRLVDTLCYESSGSHEELPLGRAVRAEVSVPERSVGRIIGRGGEKIQELQRRSHARIQVDHTRPGADSNSKDDDKNRDAKDQATRRIAITGTQDSVDAAREMIVALVSGWEIYGHGASRPHWSIVADLGSTSPHLMSPSGQEGVLVDHHLAAVEEGEFPNYLAEPYAKGPCTSIMEMETHRGPFDEHQCSTAVETEVIPCARRDVGRFIGRGGRTINNLQRRSSCSIQIDQGKQCRISIVGARRSIEAAKQMLREISEQGTCYLFAGGRGPEPRREACRGCQQLWWQLPSWADPHHLPCGYEQQLQQFHPHLPNHRQQYFTGAAPADMSAAHLQQLQHPHNPLHQQQWHLMEGHQALSSWRATADVAGRVYYYNQETMETRWDRPAN